MQLFFPSAVAPVSLFADRRVVTRESVRVRTHELAERAGRTPPNVVQADYEQAKRELTGETELERQLAILDVYHIPGDAAGSAGAAWIAS